MTVDRSEILAFLDGKMQPEDAEHVADILCRTPSEYKPAAIVNMTIDKSTIMNAMAETIQADDLDRITGILRRTRGEYQFVTVDGKVPGPNGGGLDQREMADPCQPAKRRRPYMIELPAPLFSGGWISRSLRGRLGPWESNAFFASFCNRMAAKEPAFLAIVLREVYGPDGMKDMVDAVVFAQTAYALFKDSVEPIWEKYIYCS